MFIKKYIVRSGDRVITVIMDEGSESLKPEYSLNLSSLNYVVVWGQDGKAIDFLCSCMLHLPTLSANRVIERLMMESPRRVSVNRRPIR